MSGIHQKIGLTAGVSLTALAITVFPASALAGDALTCKFDRYAAAGAVRAAGSPNALDLTWKGTNGQAMAMRLGVTAGTPVIERLAINGTTVVEAAKLEVPAMAP